MVGYSLGKALSMVRWIEGCRGCMGGLGEAKSPYERGRLQGQIEATDGQIDRLVYELFGLVEEEIGVVEGAKG